MKEISKLLQSQSPQEGFPMIGVHGYGGEQDGSQVNLSDIHYFESRKEANKRFPGGVPDYVKLHWARWTPGRGWEAVFGWWDNETSPENNPLY